MSTIAPILIADDDAAIRASLRLFLKSEGWPCLVAASPAEAQALLAKQDCSLLISDLNFERDTTSGAEGLQLISTVRELDSELPIVAMTGWGTVSVAVEAMRRGANDFVEKPWDNQRLASIVGNLLKLGQSRRASARLQAENALLRADQAGHGWIGQSPAMQAVMAKVEALAGADVNILLYGENGCGKSQLAEWIHRRSRRSAASLVTVNMGAIPETLFESELFGHVKGAFTDAREARIGRFELADGGSLFLDEVGNIPLSQQAKLLQVLESGQFERLGSSKRQQADVRLISATNADLPTLVEQGQFRRDLLYRLNSVEITLPPLRARGEDILLLAEHYLARYAQRYGKALRTLSAQAQQALRDYGWPGNVRELAHCMERATLLASGERIEAADLALSSGPAANAPALAQALEEMTLEDVEKLLIQTALRRHGGNALQAAQALGLSRSAFYRRLEKFGL